MFTDSISLGTSLYHTNQMALMKLKTGEINYYGNQSEPFRRKSAKFGNVTNIGQTFKFDKEAFTIS